jgi:signal transduction histidine kinase
LGSNLTSALLQARTGALSPQETVLLLQDLTDELRHIGRSTAQDDRGLNQVLAELRQRVQHRLEHSGLELVWDVDPMLPRVAGRHTAQNVRAMLSEAIANVIKHAQASRICLSAHVEHGSVQLVLSDNGKGFDPASTEPGRGLPGLQQRARAMGASLRVESVPAQGSRVILTLPVEEQSL